jgi:hypothetical protein
MTKSVPVFNRRSAPSTGIGQDAYTDRDIHGTIDAIGYHRHSGHQFRPHLAWEVSGVTEILYLQGVHTSLLEHPGVRQSPLDNGLQSASVVEREEPGKGAR